MLKGFEIQSHNLWLQDLSFVYVPKPRVGANGRPGRVTFSQRDRRDHGRATHTRES